MNPSSLLYTDGLNIFDMDLGMSSPCGSTNVRGPEPRAYSYRRCRQEAWNYAKEAEPKVATWRN